VMRSALIVTQFYQPEPCAAANRVAALVHALLAAGLKVDVLTAAPSFPDGRIPAEYRALTPQVDDSGDVRIIRVPTYASPRLRARDRLANWLSVAGSATLYLLLSRRRYEYVIASLPPITLALPVLVARRRARLIVDVRDVFPDIAVKLGRWREGGFAERVVGHFAAELYRQASLVLCTTATARAQVIARGSDPAKTIVAANGFDAPDVASAVPYARRQGDFVVAFVGNMGLATGLDVVLDAAARLRDVPSIRFILAGGGAEFARLAERVAAEALTNVTLLGVVPRSAANALIEDADACVVPLRRGVDDSVPSKLFDALALGCPVLCCAGGEAKALIERSGGGMALPPEDGEALAEAVRELAADPRQLEMMAHRGREYVREHHDRAHIMQYVAARLCAT
jgi:glycosyltransferase involved in cell wall biosynthesis